jgi:hypothetical protein
MLVEKELSGRNMPSLKQVKNKRTCYGNQEEINHKEISLARIVLAAAGNYWEFRTEAKRLL